MFCLSHQQILWIKKFGEEPKKTIEEVLVKLSDEDKEIVRQALK